MSKRRAKIKLSKVQIVENERNKWLAKRDAAIAMLVKSMGALVKLDRSERRLQKAALKPIRAAIAKGEACLAKPEVNAALDAGERQSTEERMRAAGFRPTRKRRDKAQSALTS